MHVHSTKLRRTGMADQANDALPEGFQACAAGTHDLVVDYKGLMSVPFDISNDGFKCARALIFLQGKTVHVPNVPGQYVTTGPYQVVTLPCMVHFDSTIRKPELCISFVDFAATNGELAGVAVETLALPLKLAGKGKYRTMANFTQVSNVVGFSRVPSFETVHITGTLKGISHFKAFDVSTASEVLTLIGQPLGLRLVKMRMHTQARIKEHVDAIAKAGDHAAAAQQLGMFDARLEKMIACFNAIPPINYDARLSARVTSMQILDGGLVDARPEWLSSPLKEQLVAGAAAMLQRSQFVQKRADGVGMAAAAAAAIEPDAREAAANAAAAIAAVDIEPNVFDEDNGDIDEAIRQKYPQPLIDVTDEDAPPVPSKRQRTATTSFKPPEAVSKAKASSSKGGRKSQDVLPDATRIANLNPRTGRAYKRGPYKQSPMPTNLKACSNKPAPESATTIALLQELVASKQRVKELEEQLELMKQTINDKIQSAKHQTTALLRLELHQQYMLGLSHGSTLARGEALSLAPMPPSSACSGSI